MGGPAPARGKDGARSQDAVRSKDAARGKDPARRKDAARGKSAARSQDATRGQDRPPPQRSAGARRPQRRGAPDPARRAAYDVLCAVAERDAYANLLLPATLTQRGLAGRDAALATELTYGTLRGAGTYDAVLAVCSDRDLAGLDPAVREILRLGTHQLLATRVAPHAAVATSVDLVRDVAGPRPAGFVNAVLRRVSTRDLEAWLQIVAPARASDLAGHLAIRYSHPRWIVEALAQALGESADGELAETEAALAADGERPRVTLCAVPGLADPAELASAGASPARWSPFGAYLAEGDPARIPAVARGQAGVQDEASQLAALALCRAEVTGRDSRWLDLCAGPGGKARLLTGLAARADARLVAAELRPHRARLVAAAISPWPAGSTGRPAGVAVADGTRPAWRPASFDRVMADVPCSGLGALRRRPEARWRRSPDTVTSLHGLQQGLLDAALESVRPGGVVAYVTCSPHLAETRGVLADELARRAGVQVMDAPALLAEVPGLACAEPDSRYAQFWPHRHGTDAIFIAILRRG